MIYPSNQRIRYVALRSNKVLGELFVLLLPLKDCSEIAEIQQIKFRAAKSRSLHCTKNTFTFHIA